MDGYGLSASHNLAGFDNLHNFPPQMSRNHPELRPRYPHQQPLDSSDDHALLAGDTEDGMPGAADFVRKLVRMLEDPVFANIVCWGVQRDCFIVKDMTEFTKVILPRLFKHSNFASFVRQLNKYDFHKASFVAPPLVWLTVSTGQEYGRKRIWRTLLDLSSPKVPRRSSRGPRGHQEKISPRKEVQRSTCCTLKVSLGLSEHQGLVRRCPRFHSAEPDRPALANPT